MTKKRIGLLAIVVVMIASVLAVSLTACNGLKDTEPETVVNHIVDGFAAASEDMSIAGMGVDATVNATVKNGDAESNYTIGAKVNLAVDPSSPATGFEFSVREGEKYLFYVQYQDKIDANSDPYIFLSYNDNYRKIKAVSLAETLKANGFTEAVADAEIDPSVVSGALTLVFSMLDDKSLTQMTKDGTQTRIRLPLGEMLTDKEGAIYTLISDTIDLSTIFGPLGIALSGTDLGEVLPYIDLVADCTFAKEKNADGIQPITGMNIQLDVNKKDIVIKKTAGGNLLEANLANDLSVKLESTFNCYTDTTSVTIAEPQNPNGYTAVNLLNLAFDGSFTLDNAVEQVLMKGETEKDNMVLKLGAGNYTVDVDLNIDPFGALQYISQATINQTYTHEGQTVYQKAGTGKKGAYVDGDKLYTTNPDEAVKVDGKPVVISQNLANPDAILSMVKSVISNSYANIVLSKDGEALITATIKYGTIQVVQSTKNPVVSGGLVGGLLPILSSPISVDKLLSQSFVQNLIGSLLKKPEPTADITAYDEKGMEATYVAPKKDGEAAAQPDIMGEVKKYAIDPLSIILNAAGLKINYNCNNIWVQDGLHLEVAVTDAILNGDGLSIAKIVVANGGTVVENEGKFSVSISNLKATLKLFDGATK